MKKNIIIAVLVAALAGALIWGITERQQIQKAELLIENGNEGSFLGFSENISEISKLMDEITVCSDEVLIAQKLAGVTKLASHAQKGIIALPVSHNTALNATDFLSLCEDYSYSLLTSHLNGASLSEDDKKSLEQLSENCENMANDIKSFSAGRTDDFTWYDPEYEFITDDDDKNFSKMFSSFENGYKNFKGIKYNGKYSAESPDDNNGKEKYDSEKIESGLSETFSKYSGVNIVKDETQDKYHSFVVSEAGNTTKLNYDLYSGKLVNARSNKTANAEKLSEDEAAQKAEEFLKSQGIENMSVISREINNNIMLLSYVYQDENAAYPSDSLKIGVSMEDGDILAYDAENYYKNHKERSYEQNRLNINDAKENLGEGFEISDEKALVMQATDGSENGAYEYTVSKNGKEYKITVDAQSGREISVERVEK